MNNHSTTLIVGGITSPTITVSKDAEKLKTELLKSSTKIKTVNDEASDGIARESVLELASFRKGVASSYDLVRRPVKDFLDKMKKIADDFGREPLSEEDRIKALRGSYTMEQERARRKLEAEAERLRMEAEEKERQAELARMKASSLSQAKAAALERQQEKLEDKVASVELAMESKKTKGSSVIWDFEVLPNGLAELYASNPRLVSLSEKRREILEELNRLDRAGLKVELPGVRTFERAQTAAR